ncbi:hypothetical protein D3C78_1589960 [compost metagenome]
MSPQVLISWLISFLKASGVPPAGSAPSVWNFLGVAGKARILLTSWLMRCTTAVGMPLGPIRPYQSVTS